MARSFLARISNSPADQTLSATSPARIEWLRGGSAPEVDQVAFEFSENGVVRTPLGSGNRIIGGWELTGLDLPVSGQLRARGRASGGGVSSSVIEQVETYVLSVMLPTVTTAAISGITLNAATGGGEVTTDGGTTVMERGLVFATTSNPTVAADTTVVAGSGAGSFTAELTGLAPATTYFVRAYATNSVGTGYGEEVSFTTSVVPTTPSFFEAVSAAGLVGDDALPTATPFHDGTPNLFKYAFNMSLAGPDASTMTVGGNSGLPVAGSNISGETVVWRVEFVRRKGSGLIYLPEKSTTLDAASFEPLTGPPTVTDIDEEWERVVVEEPYDPVTLPHFFTRVGVALP
ncbi:MAG: fibronectin type III domain-containing protein [Opitutales bacterium]|nr:fibronectin type III domain-containing protein [Opitutales bacterium]